MVARAAMEEVEFAGFVHDDDDNDDDVMGEDDHAASGGSGGGRRAAHVLPFPHILYGATPSAVLSLGGGPSDAAASQRGHFQSLYDAAASSGDLPHGPQRSIEGWIVLVTGVEEDAEENDLYNAFSEFGHVKNLHFNLGRRTGYAMGYVLIEYESFEEAQTAIGALNGTTLLTKTVYVDWAFSKGPLKQLCGTRPSRQRSRTPPRRLAALTTC